MREDQRSNQIEKWRNKEKMNMQAIHKIMVADGFVLIDQGDSPLNHTPYWRYINKDTFKVISFGEDHIDDEEFFNDIFGLGDDEVEEILLKKTGKKNLYNVMFDWSDEDFKQVIRKLIDKKKETLNKKAAEQQVRRKTGKKALR